MKEIGAAECLVVFHFLSIVGLGKCYALFLFGFCCTDLPRSMSVPDGV